MVFSYIIAVSENPVRKCATNNAVVFTSHHKNFRSSLVYTGLGQAIGRAACTHWCILFNYFPFWYHITIFTSFLMNSVKCMVYILIFTIGKVWHLIIILIYLVWFRNYSVWNKNWENLKTRQKMDKIHHCAVGRGGLARKAHKDASADVWIDIASNIPY